jgi:hypothetical protein
MLRCDESFVELWAAVYAVIRYATSRKRAGQLPNREKRRQWSASALGIGNKAAGTSVVGALPISGLEWFGELVFSARGS